MNIEMDEMDAQDKNFFEKSLQFCFLTREKAEI